MAEHLWKWTAEQVSDAVRRREVSAREVAASVLERIDTVNGAVNALPFVLREEAMAEAEAIDRSVADGSPPGPLTGVPVTIKVNVDQRGQATTNGVAAFAGTIASEDSPPVANLRRAGAVIVGRSNTPAFSIRWFTDNDVHGRTLNPWDRSVSPGGSSGGAAVAVATGMGAIGHGNDYGGSIRHPAFMCGVAGLRPTSGRVPAFNPSSGGERPLSAQLMSVQGPLARSVGDLSLALSAMAAPDPRDPSQVPAPLEGPAPDDPLRVALFRGTPAAPVAPEVARALDRAAGWLAAAGCLVEEVAPPDFDEAVGLWRSLVYEDVRRSMQSAIESHGDAAVRTNIRLILESMEPLDGDRVLALYGRRMAVARAWSRFLDNHPVLLTGVSWTHGLPIDADLMSSKASTALVVAQGPLLATAMLGLPGLSVPTGLDGGLPTGVQLVARWHREDRCLQAGRIIEAAAGVLTPIAPSS